MQAQCCLTFISKKPDNEGNSTCFNIIQNNIGMNNMKLRKWGILQERERTQTEKRVWNLSCYIVEAQIPKKVKQYYYNVLITKLLSLGCDT